MVSFRSELKCLNIFRRSYDIGRHATNLARFGVTTVYYAVPRVSERAWKIPFPFSFLLVLVLVNDLVPVSSLL